MSSRPRLSPRSSAASLALLSSLLCCCASSSAPARPRIHVYNLPAQWTEPRHHFGASVLFERLRQSQYYEPDHSKADLFWIHHQMPFRNTSWAPAVYDYIRTLWPYLNRSIAAGQTRHFITLTCDQGPGSCEYVRREDMRVGVLPSFYNPADKQRVVGHLQWNGRRDGSDAGLDSCLICFQSGKDVQMVTGQNTCGPLCGYSKEVLAAWSPWSPTATHASLHRRRNNTLFYGGRIHLRRGAEDLSGRAQIAAHAHLAGWKIVNTMGDDPDKPVPVEITSNYKSFAEEMSNAEFCFSPLGQSEGDTDRYVPAIMFGCIPVMLRTVLLSATQHAPMAFPMDERLDWSSFSVAVDIDDVQRLPEILANVTAQQRRRMRRTMGLVWRRFLWTSIYGPYLGEDASKDAFESLIDVFRLRVAAMPPLPTED